ncbi:MAG: T9SS type A sorting domain-containing protein [Bacteroidia bacterium]|nr:T9SS type A sorting domain-containing protein [Bacteroidia bacterium]NNK28983.1 T9SS type A sorting domain-containing protein [Flavobacteriaceae bacterium]
MKNFESLYLMVFVLVGMTLNAQITFNACNPIIENQDYTFNLKTVDATGRNVFETDPVTGDQDCGGIGVCEMQVAWNDAMSRWEIFADDGNGTFANTYVLYYNTEASTPNPPSLVLGTWEENIAVTASLCTDGISTLSGDVQDTTLGILDNALADQIMVYPNPATNALNIRTSGITLLEVEIIDINGRTMFKEMADFERLDVSRLSRGIYFAKMLTPYSRVTKKIVIK